MCIWALHLLDSVLVLDLVSPVAPPLHTFATALLHGDEAHTEGTASLPGTTPETKELGLHQGLFPNLRLGKQYLTGVCALQCLRSSSCHTTFPKEASCFCATLVAVSTPYHCGHSEQKCLIYACVVRALVLSLDRLGRPIIMCLDTANPLQRTEVQSTVDMIQCNPIDLWSWLPSLV